MQIKKVDWIRRPEKVRITSRTLTFRSAVPCAALYTVGENEELTLRHDGENVSFLMLHTERDYIRLAEDHTALSMKGFTSKSSQGHGKELLVKKTGDTLEFMEDGKTVITVSDPAFRDSASLGFYMEGSEKDVTLFFA